MALSPEQQMHYALKTRDAAQALIKEIDSLRVPGLSSPAPGSCAQADLDQSTNGESVTTIAAMAFQCLATAADHYDGALRNYQNPFQIYAACTCARGCLEASALAVHFCDTGVGTEQRTSRQYSWRLEGLTEQIKAGKAFGIGQAELDKTERRKATVEADAASKGYSMESHAAASPDHHIKKLKVTELARDRLDMEANYRIFSAVAHGHNWALIQFGLEVNRDRPEPIGQLVVKPEFLYFVCQTMAGCIGRATLEVFRYYGADTTGITDSLEKASKTGLIKDKFW